MGKSFYLLIGSFALFVLVAAATLESMVILQRVASVSDAQGDIRVRHHDADVATPLGTVRYVRAGDVLQTGDGSLTLNWVDGDRVKVGPHTTLQVLQCQLNSATHSAISRFRLNVGQVWVRVQKLLSPRSRFEVLTPTATAGVRGTLFSVKVDPRGSTEVSVLEGQVILRERGDDASVAVDRGHCAQIVEAPGNEPKPLGVEPLTRADRIAWRQASAIAGPFVVLTRPSAAVARLGDDGTCRVCGLAEDSATVTVNGQPVIRGSRGRFWTDLPAQPGRPLHIVVVAEDARGLRTTVLRDVTCTNPCTPPGPAR